MNATDLTCPFCNARVGDASTARVVCPRCGESFANKTSVQSPPAFTPRTISGDSSATPSTPLEFRPAAPRSNRLVLGITLGAMSLLAVSALSYALWTKPTRREHDKELPSRTRRPPTPPVAKRKPLPPADPVAPVNLEALRYLPPRTALVAGIHVHEALTSPSADDLRDRPFSIAGIEMRLENLKELLGLDAEDLDHVVIGMDAGAEGQFPPIHLIVRTREKYDADQVLESLGAVKQPADAKPPAGKRTIHEVKVKQLDGHLWLADERTFVVGLFSKLESVPQKPAKGLDLSADLRKAIEQRLRVGMSLWVAGHSEDWSKTPLPLLFRSFKETPILSKIDQLRTFAIGVVPDKPMRAEGAFRCRDEAAATKLEAEELKLRAQKDKSFQYARDKEWLTAQWKLEPGK